MALALSGVHNGSQLELAKNGGTNDWTIRKGVQDEDAVSDDSTHGAAIITKSVTVAVTRVEPRSA